MLRAYEVVRALPIVLVVLLTGIGRPTALVAQAPIDVVTVRSMTDAIQLTAEIQLRVLLDTDILEGSPLIGDEAFVKFLNFIDLQVVGQGRTTVINGDRLYEFVAQNLTRPDLADAIVIEYRRSAFAEQDNTSTVAQDGTLTIGGFFVGETELHQEPDGEYLGLLEINQMRIFFSGDLNPSAPTNRVSLLAEWNPVPEEVVHQPDAVVITRDSVSDVISPPEPDEEGELIRFEQIYARVANVAGSGIDLTIGQFRNPFGIWSDYTSHRNFTTTKNNAIVNGFALKKIELGAMASRRFANGMSFDVALVHGRNSRTFDLPRADADNAKDLVGRVAYDFGESRQVGASFYMGELRARRNAAYGVHYSLPIGRLMVSGELVYQHNGDVNDTFGTQFSFDEVSSLGSYVQLNYALTNRIDVYGMYEAWALKAGGQREPTSYKAFQGMRYSLSSRVRWVVFEVGKMFWEFDEGRFHASSQLELTF